MKRRLNTPSPDIGAVRVAGSTARAQSGFRHAIRHVASYLLGPHSTTIGLFFSRRYDFSYQSSIPKHVHLVSACFPGGMPTSRYLLGSSTISGQSESGSAFGVEPILFFFQQAVDFHYQGVESIRVFLDGSLPAQLYPPFFIRWHGLPPVGLTRPVRNGFGLARPRSGPDEPATSPISG